MRLLFTLIKTLLLFVVFGIVAVVVSFVLFIGGLIMLLSGRRSKFRVYTQNDFEQVFQRPPMRDVTPKPVETLPGQST